MLADHTLVMRTVPTDAYRLKSTVYDRLETLGVSVNPRSFLYGRCPINGAIIVRVDDDRLMSACHDSVAVLQPQVGQSYKFCLRATPMQQAVVGKVPADPETWIHHQSENVGIDLAAVRFRVGQTWCGKTTTRRPTGFYVPDVVYVGRLSVTDAEKLSAALAHGVGRHRAFGFGLLQLFD